MERKNKGFTPLEKSQANDKQQKKRFLTGPIRKKVSNVAGFTVVELLTAVAIVALMIGILLPTLTYVRNTAKETMQKAQINTIDMALTAFKNDYGDYPPSYCNRPGAPLSMPETPDYCGAQKLTEALLGWDLLGFHPDSAWRADGFDENGGEWTYDPCGVRGDDTLHERKGPYLELASTNAFRLGISAPGLQDGLFDLFTIPSLLNPNRYVLCDVFGVKKITLANGETAKAGTPILYYKANTSSKTIINPAQFYDRIYDIRDNGTLVGLRKLADWEKLWTARETHPLAPFIFFYGVPTTVPPTIGYIQDPKVGAPAPPWPYRPDSYILISAGVDGLYGTGDDITNFK